MVLPPRKQSFFYEPYLLASSELALYAHIRAYFGSMPSPAAPHPIETLLATAAQLDAQAKKALTRPNQRRADALRNSQRNGLPNITISALQGQYLAIQARLIGAKSVLEIGTLGGYSALWLAEQAGCKVTSVEINRKHRDVALQNIQGQQQQLEEGPLEQRGDGEVEILLGAALEVMPRLLAAGQTFDMVFLDASWNEQWQYFDLAVRLTRPNGCIYVDNVPRVMREELDAGKDLATESLVAKVGTDERVTATFVHTLSSHKDVLEEQLDGFLLAVVN